MAQTVAQLLEQAARQLGELQANQSLDTDTLDNVLWPIARDFLNGLAGHVTGTNLVMYEQSVAGATTLAAGNVRLSCTATCTVTMPAAPKDGWRVSAAYVASGQTLTIAGNGKKLNGGTSNVTVAAAATDEFFYRADLSDWIDPRVTANSDNAPYPDELLGGIAAMLAIEIQPALGLAIKLDTRLRAAACEKAMVERYHRKHPALFTGWKFQSVPTPRADAS